MRVSEGTWLVAVSGGADSMALLSMCLEQGIPCACGHVNYHHRPQAEQEEAYIRQFCQEHGIPCHIENREFVYTGNFEAAAREYRYAFFARIIQEFGYRGVLVGHHMDDHIETFVMQEEKGVIPDFYGLKEERMINGVLVARPLLSYTKKELEDYCQRRGIRTFFDETNSDTSLARNRIRKEVVEPLTPFERTMILEEIRSKNAVLQESRCRIKTEFDGHTFLLERYRRFSEDERLLLLYECFKNTVSYSRRGLQEVDHILMKKNDFCIPAGNKLLAEIRGRVFLAARRHPYQYPVTAPEEFHTLTSPYFRIERGTPGVNALTVSESDYPLVIRSAKEGDRIQMRFGTKSLHRFFIDRHIPLIERVIWPVVENREGRVILVSGLGCDTDHYSLSPSVSVIQLSAYE